MCGCGWIKAVRGCLDPTILDDNCRGQAIAQGTPKRYTRLRNLRYSDLSPTVKVKTYRD